ncbi:MAG: formate--tetrahydrofolate ligase [Thermoplasmata archaeon]|nr:formate--tetrahydrofolate ligase [Thermoplasmata archaeon]
MSPLSNVEIAQNAKLLPITEVAEIAGIDVEFLEPYGKYIGKVNLRIFERLKTKQSGKLILVTTINPTPAGEGKTTTTIGLAQSLAKLGHRAMLGIREPSLGPVFGVKGGAAGAGYSQVLPMEDINLHFTGDIHAVGAANNLLCALVDNSLHYGNPHGIDPRKIMLHRVLDMNDRSLRHVVVGLGGKLGGIPREDCFDITAASEVMAVLCLSKDLADLKERLGKIIVGYTMDDKPVSARDLKAVGAMALVLKDAIKPNLVQTIEHVPAFVHGGPFANIATGSSSIISTTLGLKLADYFVTEAGFGSDLGAEKFFNIVCRTGGFAPDAVVVVVTARALKWHGGVGKRELASENIEAIKRGFANLSKHLENIQMFGVPAVVAINRFHGDSQRELDEILGLCESAGIPAAISDVAERGGTGGLDLARKVVEVIKRGNKFRFLYSLDLPIKEKIEAIATRIYGAKSVSYTVEAEEAIGRAEEHGFGKLAVCMAKTQYSLSDDATLIGRPKNFKITVRDLRISAGGGFVVPLTGEISLMPGLPRKPAAFEMDIDEGGKIRGLF